MKRISRLKVTNFKFFFGEMNFDFDRKNVLIFGENGSGKSSIYWSLYTFLQSVLKGTDLEVQKYFNYSHKENLINRYAGSVTDSSIQVEYSDDLQATTTRKISLTTINTKADGLVLEACLGSEFLDYKILSRIHNFYHKEVIDLFEYFLYNLFPFINFGRQTRKSNDPTGSSNASYWWDTIKDGINPKPKMHEPIYKEFQRLVGTFNEEFGLYIDRISNAANQLLGGIFEEKFKIRLEYRPCRYNPKWDGTQSRSWKMFPPMVVLSVILPSAQLREEDRKVQSPQSFLNEARLTSVALALRFAVMDDRFVSSYPNLLVLDDLLMSMDMSNRGHVLNLILNQYRNDYQIIILTHDRVFFEDARNLIQQTEAIIARRKGEGDEKKAKTAWKEEWKVWEMYEADNGYGIPIPRVLDYRSESDKALHALKYASDYTACGSHLRKTLEGFFMEFIPAKHLPQKKMLFSLLNASRIYFSLIGFDTAPIDSLKLHLRRSLNKASHFNPLANFYKRELEEIFKVLAQLESLRIVVIVPVETILTFQLISTNNDSYAFQFKVLDDILIYRGFGINPAWYFNDSDLRAYELLKVKENGVDHTLARTERGKTLKGFVEDVKTFVEKTKTVFIQPIPNVYDLVCSSTGANLTSLKASFQ
jgi:energy-coupling factor transporter ATP-binding protein EcfA2